MFDLSLDPITYCCLVMAVGLTVDYIIHITHAISHAQPKDKYDYIQRLSIAMNQMGGSVFKGAITTLLGGLPLLLSTSKGFILFYGMISGIVFCAFLLAFIFECWSVEENFAKIIKKINTVSKLANSKFDVEFTRYNTKPIT